MAEVDLSSSIQIPANVAGQNIAIFRLSKQVLRALPRGIVNLGQLQGCTYDKLFNLQTRIGQDLARRLAAFIYELNHPVSPSEGGSTTVYEPKPDARDKEEIAGITSQAMAGDPWAVLRADFQKLPREHDSVEMSIIPHESCLNSFLISNGLETLGHMKAFDFCAYRESNAGLGKVKLPYFRQIIDWVQGGGLDVSVQSESNAAEVTVKTIDRFMGSLEPEEKDILVLRMIGESGRLWTLDELGKKCNKTRERIRQMIDGTKKGGGLVPKLRSQGGMKLHKALARIESCCENKSVPLTEPLFSQWLGNVPATYPVRFYVALAEALAPSGSLPVWQVLPTQFDRNGDNIARAEKALAEIEMDDGMPLKVDAAFHMLKQQWPDLVRAWVYAALHGNPRFTVDEDQWTFCRKQLGMLQGARLVLEQSDRALSVREIDEAGRRLFGERWPERNPRSLEHALDPQDGFYRLGAATFGLAKHIPLGQSDRLILVGQYHDYLLATGRPVGTGNFLGTRKELLEKATKYDLAALAQQDTRFEQVGRKYLFGLKSWGGTRLPEIADLILECIEEGGSSRKAIDAAVNQARITDGGSIYYTLKRLVASGDLLEDSGTYHRAGVER